MAPEEAAEYPPVMSLKLQCYIVGNAGQVLKRKRKDVLDKKRENFMWVGPSKENFRLSP